MKLTCNTCSNTFNGVVAIGETPICDNCRIPTSSIQQFTCPTCGIIELRDGRNASPECGVCLNDAIQARAKSSPLTKRRFWQKKKD